MKHNAKWERRKQKIYSWTIHEEYVISNSRFTAWRNPVFSFSFCCLLLFINHLSIQCSMFNVHELWLIFFFCYGVNFQNARGSKFTILQIHQVFYSVAVFYFILGFLVKRQQRKIRWFMINIEYRTLYISMPNTTFFISVYAECSVMCIFVCKWARNTYKRFGSLDFSLF